MTNARLAPAALGPVLLILAFVTLASQPAPLDAAPAALNPSGTLEPLGRAYAADHALPFTSLETTVAGQITPAGQAKWAAQLETALVVGIVQKGKPFQAVPLAGLAGGMRILMAGKRTPQQVVQSVAAPGSTVVEATWRFGGAAPVRSYAIFSPSGELLFDTLLSLPVVQGGNFLLH